MGWHPTQLHITMPWLAWANATHRRVYPVPPQPPKRKEPSDSNENLIHGKFLKHFVSLEGGAELGGVYWPRMFDPWPDRYKVPAPYQTHHCRVPFELEEQAAAADAAAAARVHRLVRKQKKNLPKKSLQNPIATTTTILITISAPCVWWRRIPKHDLQKSRF